MCAVVNKPNSVNIYDNTKDNKIPIINTKNTLESNLKKDKVPWVILCHITNINQTHILKQ